MSADEDAESVPLGHWGWLVLGVGVLAAGRYLGPVGVDTEALEPLTQGSVSTAFPIIGGSLGLLVLMRLVLAALRVESRGPRMIAFLIYVAITAMQGLAIGLWLESLNGLTPFGDIVAEPGWRFRLFTAASWAAGAVVLWWIADAIDQSRRAQGALFLWLAAFVLETMLGASAVGESAAQLGALLPIARWLVTPAMMLLVALVMLAKPASFPRPVLRVPLLGAWDVLALVAVATLPEQLIGGLVAFAPDLAGAAWVQWLSVAVSVGLGVGLAAWWWRSAEGDGARPIEPAAVAASALIVPAALAAFAFVTNGGIDVLTAPPPLAGDASFTLVLEAEDRFGDRDAEAMRARLVALGAEATVVEASPTSITLRVEGALGEAPVIEAVRPHRLGLHVSGSGQLSPSELPPALHLELNPYGDHAGPQVVAGDCAAAEAWLERADVAGCMLALERQAPTDGEPTCRVHCLASEPVISNGHVESAEVGMDEYSATPHVSVRLTEEGGRRLGEATRTHLREPLAILLDGEAVSVPIVQSEIGRDVQITLGSDLSYEEGLAQAHALVTTLEGEVSVAPFRVVSVN